MQVSRLSLNSFMFESFHYMNINIHICIMYMISNRDRETERERQRERHRNIVIDGYKVLNLTPWLRAWPIRKKNLF